MVIFLNLKMGLALSALLKKCKEISNGSFQKNRHRHRINDPRLCVRGSYLGLVWVLARGAWYGDNRSDFFRIHHRGKIFQGTGIRPG